jgi:hypothetical protein
MSEHEELLKELLVRTLEKETEELKVLLDIRLFNEKLLQQMTALNVAIKKLNYISGASGKVSKEEMNQMLDVHDEFSKELHDRLSKPQLEVKKEEKKNE